MSFAVLVLPVEASGDQLSQNAERGSTRGQGGPFASALPQKPFDTSLALMEATACLNPEAVFNSQSK